MPKKYNNDVNAEKKITVGNTLKAKIDADTDLAVAKADYTSIFKDNRIYAVVIPQSQGAARMENLIVKLNDTGAIQ